MRAYLFATVAIVIVVFSSNLPVSAQSSAATCRDTEVDTDRGSEIVRICSDANGGWWMEPRQSSAFDGIDSDNQLTDILPPDFSGRIAYRGTFEGATSPVPRGRQRGNLGALLGNALGANSTPIGGTYDVELTFEPGGRVSGRASGSGRASSVTLAGTRRGAQCRLFATPGDGLVEGQCTRTRFVALSTSAASERDTRYRVNLNLQASQVVDAAAEAEQRRVAAEAQANSARLAVATSTAPTTVTQTATAPRPAPSQPARYAVWPYDSGEKFHGLPACFTSDEGTTNQRYTTTYDDNNQPTTTYGSRWSNNDGRLVNGCDRSYRLRIYYQHYDTDSSRYVPRAREFDMPAGTFIGTGTNSDHFELVR